MTNADTKFMNPKRWITFTKEVIKKAHAKYSFEFTIDGAPCRVWFDLSTEKVCFDCNEKTEALAWLSEKIDHLIIGINMNDRIDIVDLLEFVCKHLQAKIKVLEEAARAPTSEREYLNDMDMENAFEEFIQEAKQRQPKG